MAKSLLKTKINRVLSIVSNAVKLLRESVDQAWVCECPRKLAVSTLVATLQVNCSGFAWRSSTSRLFHALTQHFTAFEVSSNK